MLMCSLYHSIFSQLLSWHLQCTAEGNSDARLTVSGVRITTEVEGERKEN